MALLIAGALVFSVAFSIVTPGPVDTAIRARAATRMTWPLCGYLDNYKTEPYLSSILAPAFSDGSSIVLFGSSELTTTDHPAKPFNFFNNTLGMPLLAIGHAGSQSFAIHSQLISSGADLHNARIAILISPSWFVDRAGMEGTSLSCFLEYNPAPSLYRVNAGLSKGDTAGLAVRGFLVEHHHELGDAQPIVKHMIQGGSTTELARYWFSLPWNSLLVDRTSATMLASARPTPKPLVPVAPPEAAPDWDSLYAKARAEHLAVCTNNKAFVNDAYYTEHVNGATRRIEPVQLEANREYADFIGLLDHLRAKGARPVFIIQPLNPFVYTDLKEIDPTIDAIRKALDERDFAYLDLWISDTARFEPGVLTDVMHLGPLGWYRVDSMILAHFQ